MPRASTVEMLPQDILEKLQALLRDPRVSQLQAVAEINAVLTDMGERPVSKSAVNRYAVKMDKVGEKLRQSREVAEMWIAKMGAQPQGQVGHLINEMLRTMAFDLTIRLQESELTAESMPEVIDMLKHLSLSVVRLERAASENVKREQEIKRQVLEEAADSIEEEAIAQGMDNDQVRLWRGKVLRGL